jgi:hypothetical protein
MNAMVIQDLAIDMIELYRRLPPAQVKPGAALQRHPL